VDHSLAARLSGTACLHPRSVCPQVPAEPCMVLLRSDLFIFWFKVATAAYPGVCHKSMYRCLRVQSPPKLKNCVARRAPNPSTLLVRNGPGHVVPQTTAGHHLRACNPAHAKAKPGSKLPLTN